MIDAIWAKYDLDKNGVLDFEETLMFVKDMIDPNITAAVFEPIFREFDADNSGTIDRDEIAAFLNKFANHESDATSPLSPQKMGDQQSGITIKESTDSEESHSLTDSEGSVNGPKKYPQSFRIKDREKKSSKKITGEINVKH